MFEVTQRKLFNSQLVVGQGECCLWRLTLAAVFIFHGAVRKDTGQCCIQLYIGSKESVATPTFMDKFLFGFELVVLSVDPTSYYDITSSKKQQTVSRMTLFTIVLDCHTRFLRAMECRALIPWHRSLPCEVQSVL